MQLKLPEKLDAREDRDELVQRLNRFRRENLLSPLEHVILFRRRARRPRRNIIRFPCEEMDPSESVLHSGSKELAYQAKK